MEKVTKISIDGFNNPIFFRENTTDLNCLIEVIEKADYRHIPLGFDVEEGEEWLDLGGNIGAFALYAHKNGAKKVTSYEPDKDNYRILKLNISKIDGYEAVNSAITIEKKDSLEFFSGKKDTDRYRYSHLASGRSIGKINNKYGEFLRELCCDGVKMDIEGSELGLIDKKFIPKCNKLVMEYHLTRDKSLKNLSRRLDILRDHFDNVYIIPSLQKLIDSGMEDYPGFFDRVIRCWNNKD